MYNHILNIGYIITIASTTLIFKKFQIYKNKKQNSKAASHKIMEILTYFFTNINAMHYQPNIFQLLIIKTSFIQISTQKK